MANAEADARELFGSQWPNVAAVLYALRERYRIYYGDPRPGNINWGVAIEDDDEWWRDAPLDYDACE
jgi:hypothetical protein